MTQFSRMYILISFCVVAVQCYIFGLKYVVVDCAYWIVTTPVIVIK